MQSESRILVVGGSPEEFGHIEQCLPDWECVSVSLDADGTAISGPIPAQPCLILVYAQPGETDTLSICQQLREDAASRDAPILLVVGRYHVVQGNAVKRMGNAEFIMTPFDEDELRSKIDPLVGDS